MVELLYLLQGVSNFMLTVGNKEKKNPQNVNKQITFLLYVFLNIF